LTELPPGALSPRPDLPVSEQVAQGLGRVIVAFGKLEAELLAIIAMVLSTHVTLARAAMAPLTFGPRVDVLVSLVWARWQEDVPIDTVNQTVKRLRAAAKLRNQYVHSLLWGSALYDPPHTPSPMATYFGGQRGTHASIQIMGLLTPTELDNAVVEIEATTFELVWLHAELEGVARWYGDYLEISPEWVRR
jgi:hypothetical protein